jgi:hypothetical protein
MYSPRIISSEKKLDGMTYLVVDFVSDSGQPTVRRNTHTDTFTLEWFKVWCKRQVDLLEVPQDALPTAGETISLVGVTTEPDTATRARREFDERLANLERMTKLATLGVIAADHAELVKVRGEMVTAIAARPALLKVR